MRLVCRAGYAWRLIAILVPGSSFHLCSTHSVEEVAHSVGQVTWRTPLLFAEPELFAFIEWAILYPLSGASQMSARYACSDECLVWRT